MKFTSTSGALLALLACPLAAGPARAADTSTNDFHCMVIGTIMADAANEEIKNAGLFMTLYYLGRLDGSGKDVDFVGGYKSEMAKFPQLDIETEAKSCSALLTARGATLSKMAPPPDAAPPATPGPAKPAP
jgi:hypothetical protein